MSPHPLIAAALDDTRRVLTALEQRDAYIAFASDIERRQRELVTGACRTCGAPVTRNAKDCGGDCATVDTTTVRWGVWQSWADCQDGAKPYAIVTSEETARACLRLAPGAYSELHHTYSFRPYTENENAHAEAQEAAARLDQQRLEYYFICAKWMHGYCAKAQPHKIKHTCAATKIRAAEYWRFHSV